MGRGLANGPTRVAGDSLAARAGVIPAGQASPKLGYGPVAAITGHTSSLAALVAVPASASDPLAERAPSGRCLTGGEGGQSRGTVLFVGRPNRRRHHLLPEHLRAWTAVNKPVADWEAHCSSSCCDYHWKTVAWQADKHAASCTVAPDPLAVLLRWASGDALLRFCAWMASPKRRWGKRPATASAAGDDPRRSHVACSSARLAKLLLLPRRSAPYPP